MPVPTVGNISLPETKTSHRSGRPKTHQELKGGIGESTSPMTLGNLALHSGEEDDEPAQGLVSDFEELVQEQPIVVAAVCAAVGFAVGYLCCRR